MKKITLTNLKNNQIIMNKTMYDADIDNTIIFYQQIPYIYIEIEGKPLVGGI